MNLLNNITKYNNSLINVIISLLAKQKLKVNDDICQIIRSLSAKQRFGERHFHFII